MSKKFFSPWRASWRNMGGADGISACFEVKDRNDQRIAVLYHHDFDSYDETGARVNDDDPYPTLIMRAAANSIAVAPEAIDALKRLAKRFTHLEKLYFDLKGEPIPNVPANEISTARAVLARCEATIE